MKYIQKLKKVIEDTKSHVVVGLDTSMKLIPGFFKKFPNPILEFNKAVIDATRDFAAGYKINLAFYESEGLMGIEALHKTVEYIPDELIKICDAKRCDIENTSEMYAKAYFDNLSFDAITLSPYMGHDSFKPYLKRDDKLIYVLILTSNKGAKDFQFLKTGDKYLHEVIAGKCLRWSSDKTGFVIGANHLKKIKYYSSPPFNVPLLIPGIGAQKNDLKKLLINLNNRLFLINSSRGIIYSAGENCNKRELKTKVQKALILLKNRISENIN